MWNDIGSQVYLPHDLTLPGTSCTKVQASGKEGKRKRKKFHSNIKSRVMSSDNLYFPLGSIESLASCHSGSFVHLFASSLLSFLSSSIIMMMVSCSLPSMHLLEHHLVQPKNGGNCCSDRKDLVRVLRFYFFIACMHASLWSSMT